MRSAARLVLTALPALAIAGLAVGCRAGGGARNAEMGSFHGASVGANADPTIRPARLLPEVIDESSSYGSEAGGGTRVITAGLRVVTSPNGAILTAEDRLPQPPLTTVALPERLGGGFLFVVGNVIWRSDRWLGRAKPIFTSTLPMQAIVPGLDRVYVRSQNAVLALDGRTGHVLDLGPWPASPYVASYAAADGWRAAAVTDLRGVVATFDAGATWRPLDLPLPLEAKQIVVSGDSLAIGGFEGGRSESWYELRADGSLARLGAAPRELKTKLVPTAHGPVRPTYGGMVMPAPPTPAKRPREALEPPNADAERHDGEDFALKTFGKRPLATAIEDGWPLTDGTAVVARDGALARVRIEDGALTELVRDAFPLKPARCHPVTLTRPTAQGAFGFVCGEPRGATVIYAYEPLRGRLAEIKRFDKPRVVASSGNGALAVRGPCAEDADTPAPPLPQVVRGSEHDETSDKDRDRAKEPKDRTRSKTPAENEKKESGKKDSGRKDDDKTDEEKKVHEKDKSPAAEKAPPRTEIHPYCVLGHDNRWREIHIRGEVGGERVVVLADGRIAVVSPPQVYDGPARLTILDKGRATTLPIQFPRVTTEVARVLRLGLWLDGFEERRPGVLGGWVEGGGVLLGIEIGIDGHATPGKYLSDAGMPFVSGRYGFGFSSAPRAYETTDGGMSWTHVDVPAPLVPIAKVERRACGPIGCLAAGWLRVGWGEAKAQPSETPPAAYRSATSLSLPLLQLACDPTAGPPPSPPGGGSRSASAVASPPPQIRLHLGSQPVVASFQGLTEFLPFFALAAPTLREADRGISNDVRELVGRERSSNFGSLARVYGWGPKGGDWDTLGRWQVKWLSPFAGWQDAHVSLPALPPQFILEQTRGYSTGQNATYQLAPGDDPSHALLLARRQVRADPILFEVEADRVPVEVHRADGEPFAEIEGAVRVAGRWYVSTPAAPSGPATPTTAAAAPVTVVWQIEGAVARELARIPRTLPENASARDARTRLARRSDGRAIGLVVDGQPTAERPSAVRWVLPLELESGSLGEPEPLGYTDLAGRVLEGCSEDVVGWVVDAPLGGATVRLHLPHGSGTVSGVEARLRLTRERACVERLAGSYDGQSAERAAQLSRAGAGAGAPGAGGTRAALRSGELLVTATSAQTRYALRCTVTK